MVMDQNIDESHPLLHRKHSIWAKRLLCVAFSILFVSLLLYYVPNINMKQLSTSNKQVPLPRVLYTDNPNRYLCDADFLYEIDAINEDATEPEYHFTCLGEEGHLMCDEGYTLNCLASATYGNAAGGCYELEDRPLGCGWSYEQSPVICSSWDCIGSHESQVAECVDDSNKWIETITPCLDCMPLCHCGHDSPQFYNVADCFGDPQSSVCLGNTEDAARDAALNLYLPQLVWEKYCEHQNSCHLGFTPAAYQCVDDDGELLNYYDGIVVNHGEATVLFEDAEDVIHDYYTDCQQMDIKLLAVCEKHRSTLK